MRLKSIPLDRESKSSFFSPHTGGTVGSPVPPPVSWLGKIGKLGGSRKILAKLSRLTSDLLDFCFDFSLWDLATSLSACIRGIGVLPRQQIQPYYGGWSRCMPFHAHADMAHYRCHVSMVSMCPGHPTAVRSFQFCACGNKSEVIRQRIGSERLIWSWVKIVDQWKKFVEISPRVTAKVLTGGGGSKLRMSWRNNIFCLWVLNLWKNCGNKVKRPKMWYLTHPPT